MSTEIRREMDGAGGRYILCRNGEEAELTISVTSPTLVIADHTGVPEAMRGTGAGQALVARLVADARSEDFKIVPFCPFVNAQRQRHPDWEDVFQS